MASVDGRGTGSRGYPFMQQTYKNLGELEAEDVLSAVRYFKGEAKEYKAHRVCVWGWR